MNAKEGFIVRFLDGTDKKFVIPVYQRPYSWKTSNCELLLKDLIEVSKQGYSSHFFGSIVYVVNDLGGCIEYIIIDGQQRLTTVSLLLLAIRNYIIKEKISTSINPTKITKAYLTDEYAGGDKKLKLKLIQGDDDAYDRLIENTEPIEGNNISKNYKFFYNKLCDFTVKEIEGIYSAIMKLMIVNISLKPKDGEDDPQLIFESLNSTGLNLEEADKIRNFILMKHTAKDQEKIYKNYWEKIEAKVTKTEINKFIRHYIAVKTRDLANENRLYFAFKKYRESLNEKIEVVLADMLIFANYYSEIKKTKGSAPYLKSLARLNKLEVNTVIPLLFDLYNAKSKDMLSNDEMNKAILILESYIVRRTICGLQASSLNKIFAYFGAEIDKYVEKYGAKYIDAFTYAILSKTQKSRFPNDNDFAEKFIMFELYATKSSTRKYLFERLENYKNKERVAVEEQIDSGELTIEHIMPQTLTGDWKNCLGENWELLHTKYLNTIGNLTLTAYNSDYSNLLFEKKRDMIEKGFASSKLSLNKSLGNRILWNEEEIILRAKELLKWANDIWQIPQTDFIPNIEEEWIGLEEDFDFTNKTIVKYNFLGDEILSDNITDVYKKISTFLYSMDQVLFINSVSKYHNCDTSELRETYKIGDKMYIETNLSSQAKINALKELFEFFEVDEQELKFLVRSKSKNTVTFNIYDESTFDSLTAGKLAYELIAKLLNEHKIDESEISKLMTKEYTRSHFNKVVYPVIALSRNANQGNSKYSRYYELPVNIRGTDYYISSQWFDESRKDLVNWYNQHKM